MSTQHELLDRAIRKIGNRYLTTMLIAKRIRQLYHGARPRVVREEGESNFTIAVREIAEGHLSLQPPVTVPIYGDGTSLSYDPKTAEHVASSAEMSDPA